MGKPNRKRVDRSGTSSRPHAAGGFGLVETIVGAAIISLVLFALAEIGQFTFRVVDESNLRLRSAFLIEEGAEAVRTHRDTSWAGNIAPLALDTDYYLAFSGSVWQLSLTPGALADGIFDRRVVFSAVYRDSFDVITATGGTLDPNTKKVTVRVMWSNRGRQATSAISTYFTNLFSN